MVHFDQEIGALKEELVALRRALHLIPEPGFHEVETANRVSCYLEKQGLEVKTGIGGTGVVGVLRGTGAGPTIALRACLDALPLVERSTVDYVSKNIGFMHACGHDGNMTFVLGAANILSRHQNLLNGNVKFIFQPSEENAGGAAEMIKAGALQDPDVDAIVTLHNWHGLKQGIFGVKPGSVLASSDTFQLKVIGRPGHGAWPHLAVDPIVVSAEIISQLQTIISREIDPIKAGAISIGKISGGTAVNIIPETVTLDGTVRALDPEVRDYIQTRIEEIVNGVTLAARATYELTYTRIMPPVDNEVELTARIAAILKNAFEPGMIRDDFPTSMGCEEFSLFQQHIPGHFLFIGNDVAGREAIPLHSPGFCFNDEILTIGVKALCEIAFGYVNES